MKIIQISVHYPPNLGGVETHLADLVKFMKKENHSVDVLAYRPLITKTRWKFYERESNLVTIRIPYLPGLFYRLVKRPALEFLYLVPGLFVFLPFILFIRRPHVIQAHGLVAGFVGVFWGKLFGVRTVVTAHNIYNFPSKGSYRLLAKRIFYFSDHILTLSKQSKKEIESLGIASQKVTNFTYWIDLEKFQETKNKKLSNKYKGFNVLFVGRLVKIKGVLELLKAASVWDKNIRLLMAGDGPLSCEVIGYQKKFSNICFLGRLSQNELPAYYSLADILVVPSINEEGFGRVIIESLACGTPVIGSRKGGIPEALSVSVGDFFNPTPAEIKHKVEYYYKHRKILKKKADRTRSYVEKKYSEKNAKKIVRCLK